MLASCDNLITDIYTIYQGDLIFKSRENFTDRCLKPSFGKDYN